MLALHGSWILVLRGAHMACAVGESRQHDSEAQIEPELLLAMRSSIADSAREDSAAARVAAEVRDACIHRDASRASRRETWCPPWIDGGLMRPKVPRYMAR